MKLRTIGIALVLTILGAQSSHAQFGEVLPPWFKLQDADVMAISAAENRILANQPVKAGASEAWAGKGTGNTGKVSVKKLSKRKGLSCLETEYLFKFARARDSIRYMVPWCKDKDGAWKMVF